VRFSTVQNSNYPRDFGRVHSELNLDDVANILHRRRSRCKSQVKGSMRLVISMFDIASNLVRLFCLLHACSTSGAQI